MTPQYFYLISVVKQNALPNTCVSHDLYSDLKERDM